MGSKKKKRPERPIEISKLIDKYIEKGGITIAPGGLSLPPSNDGSGLIDTTLRVMGPDHKPASKKTKKTEKDKNA